MPLAVIGHRNQLLAGLIGSAALRSGICHHDKIACLRNSHAKGDKAVFDRGDFRGFHKQRQPVIGIRLQIHQFILHSGAFQRNRTITDILFLLGICSIMNTDCKDIVTAFGRSVGGTQCGPLPFRACCFCIHGADMLHVCIIDNKVGTPMGYTVEIKGEGVSKVSLQIHTLCDLHIEIFFFAAF